MNTLLKQIIFSALLLIPILSFAQESRFIELTVSDNVTLKSIGYTYQIDIGPQMEIMGIKIPQQNSQDKPTTSITEVTNTLKKGHFHYTLSTDQDYTISSTSSHPSILVNVDNENELKSLINLLKQQPGISGKIKEVKYESISEYQSQIFKTFYEKAFTQATFMANISDNIIGRLLSVSDVKSNTEDDSDLYKQMLMKMPAQMFGQTTNLEKKEEIKMTFKFELK